MIRFLLEYKTDEGDRHTLYRYETIGKCIPGQCKGVWLIDLDCGEPVCVPTEGITISVRKCPHWPGKSQGVASTL